MTKSQQIDLEELIDAFTGEIFKPRSRNHYEANDGVPVAPQVDLNRPSIRQRIENLLNRDPSVLQRYMVEGPPDGQEGLDLEVPDDPDTPLTASEQNYLDKVAADLAEQAPLPDEGLPRPQPTASTGSPAETAPAAPGGGAGAVPAGGSPPVAAPAAKS